MLFSLLVFFPMFVVFGNCSSHSVHLRVSSSGTPACFVVGSRANLSLKAAEEERGAWLDVENSPGRAARDEGRGARGGDPKAGPHLFGLGKPPACRNSRAARGGPRQEAVAVLYFSAETSL